MAFKFYMDGQLTDQPIGDLNLITSISRDDNAGGILINQDVRLEWAKNNNVTTGQISGFTYLKTTFDAGICNEVELVIYDEVGPTETYLNHTGVIKLTQIEFNEQPITIVTKTQDNSFNSYIYNNRELKVDLRAIQTKNKLAIDPIDWYSVDLFNGCTGTFGSGVGARYKGYLITDIFAFIISVISDNKVGFQSDYLTNLTYPLMLFKGESILNPYTIYPTSDPVFELSFQTVLNEVNKLKNIYFYIDTADPDNPILRLERNEDTYTASSGITFDEPLNVKTTVDIKNLYGKVSVGSEITVDGDNSTGCIYTMDEAISYYGFRQEEFFPLGQCNRNLELRLINEWIVSNNVIQDIIVGQSASYLDDYVLVEVFGGSIIGLTAMAFRWNFFGQGAPPFLYNLGLNNYEKMQRHSDKFETIFGNFLGIGGLGFRALLGIAPVDDITYTTSSVFGPNFIPPGGLLETAEFVNETTNGGFDGSNNYSNTLFEYTVPADGNYSFHERLHIEAESLPDPSYFEVDCIINLYDSAMTLKSTITGGATIYNNGFSFADGTMVADCLTGDIVQAEYQLRYFPNGAGQQLGATLTVIWDSYFECNGTPEGGVSITSGNASIKKLLHEFTYPILQTDWRTIVANPTASYTLIKDGVSYNGWIQEMTHNDQTTQTQIKLISSNATS